MSQMLLTVVRAVLAVSYVERNSALKAAHFAHKTHFDLPLAYALCSAAFGGDVLRWHTAFAALRDKGRPSSPPV